jgi:alkylation response protein AidB-like acyl-CoA dehydrogenase
MAFELTPVTPAGARFAELAEELARTLEPAAAIHDRDGSFPFASFRLLRSHGYFAAPLPAELGGLGVSSVHDVLVASNRLARGDASLAIGANMHFAYLLNVVHRRDAAVATGDARRAEAFGASLREIAERGIVFAAAISEPGQDLTRPATTATRNGEGWNLNGRKIFCTMSPGADVLYVATTYVDGAGRELYGYATVPTDAEGLVVHGDWDALGMRASGSHSITLDAVAVPFSALRGGFPVGDAVAYMERNLTPGLFHAAAAFGIAEHAHTVALARARLDAHAETLVGQQVADLAACAGALMRAATLLDERAADTATLFAEAQAAKAVVCDAAIRIVDRALALSGGHGYTNGSSLARAYRDVRAAPFMHPLAAGRANGFLAQFALGREPELH